MSVVSGIGWISQREYGCVMRKMRRSYLDIGSLRTELLNDSVFLYPVKSFGKFDRVSKMTCCVAALALFDAGISYSETRKQDIGILGTNSDGCLQTNVDFFKDFVEFGRTKGRATLFVYTLPSIPVAEAAIYFGCQGPTLYMTFSEKQTPSLLRHADKIILRRESPAMLALNASEEDALCFFLGRKQDVSPGRTIGLGEVIDIAEAARPLDETIGALSIM
jgi:hypothetical protein